MSKVYFLQIVITNSIWICTFMMAFPINVGTKNFLKGIRKWPQVIPAKSKSGFGMDAQRRMVINPYFSIFSKIRILAFSIKVRFCFCFKCSISSISSFYNSYSVTFGGWIDSDELGVDYWDYYTSGNFSSSGLIFCDLFNPIYCILLSSYFVLDALNWLIE